MKTSICVALAAMLLGSFFTEAQVSGPATPMSGIHPEHHGPATSTSPTAEPAPVIVTARHYRRHRPHWKTTAGHRSRCKRRFRTYNPRTNLYVARPGVRRRCVL